MPDDTQLLRHSARQQQLKYKSNTSANKNVKNKWHVVRFLATRNLETRTRQHQTPRNTETDLYYYYNTGIQFEHFQGSNLPSHRNTNVLSLNTINSTTPSLDNPISYLKTPPLYKRPTRTVIQPPAT